jgi:hypothetical protein
MAVFGVLQKVGYRNRRLRFVERKSDIAHGCFENGSCHKDAFVENKKGFELREMQKLRGD